MDEIVKAAMAKWPNVPAVYGWLELTARGIWKIRGEPIGNEAIRAFIGRNYTNDGQGNWYFQNGPQRVYVALEATPLIYHLDECGRLQAHTGARPRELLAAHADAGGRLLLETELGPGLVDGRDTAKFAERMVDGRGHAIDEASLERWLAGDGEVFLQSDGLHLERDGAVRVARAPSDYWPETFGYVARPGDGRIT